MELPFSDTLLIHQMESNVSVYFNLGTPHHLTTFLPSSKSRLIRRHATILLLNGIFQFLKYGNGGGGWKGRESVKLVALAAHFQYRLCIE